MAQGDSAGSHEVADLPVLPAGCEHLPDTPQPGDRDHRRGAALALFDAQRARTIYPLAHQQGARYGEQLQTAAA